MKYGRWTVLSEAPGVRYQNGVHKRYECLCECGTKRIVAAQNLKRGLSLSCGCLRDELAASKATTHGETTGKNPSPEYVAWVSMKARCNNPNTTNFKNYGGRGISVCSRWDSGEGGQSGFECFLSDMGRRPTAAHSLEREDNSGNYQPGNCVWATAKEQGRNTRKNRIVEICGVQMPLSAAIEKHAVVGKNTIYSRLHYGWSLQAAIFTPLRGRNF